jgi:hypothetical protein
LEHKGISISFVKSQHMLIKDYGFIALLLHLVYTAGAKAGSAQRHFVRGSRLALRRGAGGNRYSFVEQDFFSPTNKKQTYKQDLSMPGIAP